MAHNPSLYLSVESTPSVITIKPSGLQGGAQLVDQLIFNDSIFDFFPYGEIHLLDTVGNILESHGPVEEAECTFTFGTNNPQVPRMIAHFSVQGMDLVNLGRDRQYSGTNIIYLKSSYANYNYADGLAYTGELSSIAQQQANALTVGTRGPVSNDPTVIASPFVVSPTTNTGTFYKNGQTISDFLLNYARYANSTTNSGAPYFTFINMKGQFYFVNVIDLIAQSPINTQPYELINKVNPSNPQYQTKYNILSAEVSFRGNSLNKYNYNKQLHSIKYSSGNTFTETSTVVDHAPLALPGTVNPRYPFVLDKTSISRAHSYYGIDYSDGTLYEGWKNNLFLDSAFPYRKHIIIPYNSEAVSGRTINLNIYTALPNSTGFSSTTAKLAPEYSGIWTILRSSFIHSKNGSPYMDLIVGKPKLDFNAENTNQGTFAS